MLQRHCNDLMPCFVDGSGHAGKPEQLPGGHLLLIPIFPLPLNRVSQKNALSKLPLCETGFEGMWPPTASWLLKHQVQVQFFFWPYSRNAHHLSSTLLCCPSFHYQYPEAAYHIMCGYRWQLTSQCHRWTRIHFWWQIEIFVTVAMMF